MSRPTLTAGIDVGDRYSYPCFLDTETGEVIEEARISTTPAAFERRFAGAKPMRLAIEAGTHSPWISRLLERSGHEVLVANARKLKLIYGEGRKNDKLGAENLARLARLDPKLLSPLKHRGEASQAHMAFVRSREVLVEARTKLVNHLRGTVKSLGARLPKCSTASFHHKVREHMPEVLVPALEPIVSRIGSLTARIREYDRELEALSRELYPETTLLRQIQGAGPITLRWPSYWSSKTPGGSPRAVRWVPTPGSSRAKTSPARTTRSSASPDEGTRCSKEASGR
jgi:transposase